MERLYHELRDEEFEIVAVSVDATIGQADSMGIPGGDIGVFAESLSLTFPIPRAESRGSTRRPASPNPSLSAETG